MAHYGSRPTQDRDCTKQFNKKTKSWKQNDPIYDLTIVRPYKKTEVIEEN